MVSGVGLDKHTVLQNNCYLKVLVGARSWARLMAVD